jgi:hypothetical protein
VRFTAIIKIQNIALIFAASNVRSLLKLADRYDCQLLRDRCEAHLINCIEIPLVERINFAASYVLKDLEVSFGLLIQKIGAFFCLEYINYKCPTNLFLCKR